MPLRGDICQHFDSTMFRYYLKKRYKRVDSFADRMDVSFQAVYAWLNGTRQPTWRNVIKIADVLKISPRLLITPKQRFIIDAWTDKLLEHVADGKDTLTERGAIDLTEKLGLFDVDTTIEVEITEAEQQNDDLLDEGVEPDISE